MEMGSIFTSLVTGDRVAQEEKWKCGLVSLSSTLRPNIILMWFSKNNDMEETIISLEEGVKCWSHEPSLGCLVVRAGRRAAVCWSALPC